MHTYDYKIQNKTTLRLCNEIILYDYKNALKPKYERITTMLQLWNQKQVTTMWADIYKKCFWIWWNFFDAGLVLDVLRLIFKNKQMYYTIPKKTKTLFIYIICRKNFFRFFQKVFKKYLTLYNGSVIIKV